MKEQKNQSLINFFKKIKLKDQEFIAFTYIFVLVRLLPFFVITHDINLLKSRGISKYLFPFTLCTIIHELSGLALIIILLIFLLVSILPAIMIVIYYFRIKKYSTTYFIFKSNFKFFVKWIYIIPYLASQYIYSFIMEVIFIDRKMDINNALKLVFIVIMGIFAAYCIILSFILSILSIGPFFSTNNILITELGTFDIKWALLSIGQGLLQLEYFIDFKYMGIIKLIFRGTYILNFLYNIFIVYKRIASKAIFVDFVFFMCLFSSIVEMLNLYGYKRQMTTLTENWMIITVKLAVEIALSTITVIYMATKEQKVIQGFFSKDNQYQLRESNLLYNEFNKLLIDYSGN